MVFLSERDTHSRRASEIFILTYVSIALNVFGYAITALSGNNAVKRKDSRLLLCALCYII